jgi:hypothetical protein
MLVMQVTLSYYRQVSQSSQKLDSSSPIARLIRQDFVRRCSWKDFPHRVPILQRLGRKLHTQQRWNRTLSLTMPQTFEAFLRCQFRGLPMERKIQQGDYRLLLATSQRTSIQKSDWENVVQPGSSVVMSLEMQALSLAIRVGYKKGKCPRKDCAGVLAQMPQQAIFLWQVNWQDSPPNSPF